MVEFRQGSAGFVAAECGVDAAGYISDSEPLTT